jgi:hypothetical protein
LNVFNHVKRNNPFFLMQKKERKVLKTYEKDMKMIAQSLLSFGASCYNNGIKKRLANILGSNNFDPNDQTSLNKLNITLYKNSLRKIIK